MDNVQASRGQAAQIQREKKHCRGCHPSAPWAKAVTSTGLSPRPLAFRGWGASCTLPILAMQKAIECNAQCSKAGCPVSSPRCPEGSQSRLGWGHLLQTSPSVRSPAGMPGPAAPSRSLHPLADAGSGLPLRHLPYLPARGERRGGAGRSRQARARPSYRQVDGWRGRLPEDIQAAATSERAASRAALGFEFPPPSH